MKYGIIGGGPSGLTMGLFLKDPHEVLEANNHPGGVASSFTEDGYTFDYGPHIMFSKYQEILDFMIRSLKGNIHKSKRNNKVSFKRKLIKYPFENDLKALPPEDNLRCLKGFVYNPYKEKYKKPKNLREWLLAHFGEGICELYLFPYNEKVWNIPVDKLSMLWADRIPNPPPEDILKSAIGYETEGYLHQLYYHYPFKGGYQAISDAWAKKVNIKYGFAVKTITKTKKGIFIVSNGTEEKEYDQLISTIPIHRLIEMTNLTIPKKVIQAAKNLIINPMYIISLGIKGVDTNQYTALYFPEADFLVNRVSFPSVFSPQNAPKGHYSLQAEITCRQDSETWKMTEKEILKHTIDGLIQRNIIPNKKDISFMKVTRVPYAYVVYDTKYEINATIVRNWFPKQGIHLVGRFSYFEYVNVDMVIKRSMEIAGHINKKAVNLDTITL